MSVSKRERARRVSFIQQAIARGTGRFFGGEKLLYPLADYVLLAFQEPTCFSIWRTGDQPRLAFTSFKDPSLISEAAFECGRHLQSIDLNRVTLGSRAGILTDFFATVHEVTPKGFLPSPPEKVELLRAILAFDRGEAFADSFATALATSLKEHKLTHGQGSDCKGAQLLTDEEASEYLSPMRDVLDEAFLELGEHRSFSVKISPESHVPNLFAAIRSVRSPEKRFGVFPYTASLLLSNTQRQSLPTICRESSVFLTHRGSCDIVCSESGCDSALESPLGTEARAIFDSVFYSGCVDFGLAGETGEAGQWRDVSGGTRADSIRQSVERCVYGVLTQGQESRIVYVPIHVGGAPWLALFTLTRTSEGFAWDDNYCFYRDIIAKLSDRIRLGAQRVYITTLVEELKSALDARSEDLFADVNGRWKRVSQIYPFRLHTLSPCSPTDHGALRLPRGVFANLKEVANPFCQSQIEYGHVVTEVLRQRLQQELDLRGHIELRANEGMRDRLQSQAHTILNSLPCGTLREALRATELEESARMAGDALKRTEIVEASLIVALGRTLPSDFPRTPMTILRWLFDRTPSDKILPTMDFAGGGQDFLLDLGDVPAAFTILWNLWDNAERVTASGRDGWFNVHVHTTSDKGRLIVTFENVGEMPRPWIEYLRRLGPSPNTKPHRCGLEIVMGLLPDLHWEMDAPLVRGSTTSLSLRMHREV